VKKENELGEVGHAVGSTTFIMYLWAKGVRIGYRDALRSP